MRICLVDAAVGHLANPGEAGGGIIWSGNLTIDQCTIAGNTASGNNPFLGGGGVAVAAGGLTMTNSTLTGNTASTVGGGAELINGVLNLLNVTVTANQALFLGGLASVGINPGTVALANSIVAGNTAAIFGGDCFFNGVPVTSDHSLDSDNSCGLTDAGSKPGVNPLLGPLANNGGPTDTQALLAGSPAIDAGDNATCLPTDQRGVTRPQGPACDIGAFELDAQDQIAALIAQINALVTGGSLAQNNANPLITKLNQVANKLNAAQTTAACGQLGAFINQVNADIGNGTLTSAQGQPLLDAVNVLEASLGCANACPCAAIPGFLALLNGQSGSLVSCQEQFGPGAAIWVVSTANDSVEAGLFQGVPGTGLACELGRFGAGGSVFDITQAQSDACVSLLKQKAVAAGLTCM